LADLVNAADDDVGHHGITSAVGPATREAGEGTRNIVVSDLGVDNDCKGSEKEGYKSGDEFHLDLACLST
jgi:hypothetical protein